MAVPSWLPRVTFPPWAAPVNGEVKMPAAPVLLISVSYVNCGGAMAELTENEPAARR